MLLRHRGVLTLLVLVALSGAAVAGTWLAWSWPVDPATASLAQVGRTLVLNDLSAIPLSRQQAWVDRLQSELQTEHELSSLSVELSPAQQQQLKSNLAQLQEVWFKTRLHEYRQLQADQRTQFLQLQVDSIVAWSKMESQLSEPDPGQTSGMSALLAQIDRWQLTANDQERIALKQALTEGTLYWLSITDLALQSPEARQAIAARIAGDVRKGNVAGSLTQSMTPDQRERFLANARLLVESYIHQLAPQYAAVERSERPAFLDRELTSFEQSGVLKLVAESADTSADAKSATLQLAEQVLGWIENAPETQRVQVAKLVTALQQRMYQRQFPSRRQN